MSNSLAPLISLLLLWGSVAGAFRPNLRQNEPQHQQCPPKPVSLLHTRSSNFALSMAPGADTKFEDDPNYDDAMKPQLLGKLNTGVQRILFVAGTVATIPLRTRFGHDAVLVWIVVPFTFSSLLASVFYYIPLSRRRSVVLIRACMEIVHISLRVFQMFVLGDILEMPYIIWVGKNTDGMQSVATAFALPWGLKRLQACNWLPKWAKKALDGEM